jgi:hypothetical protein
MKERDHHTLRRTVSKITELNIHWRPFSTKTVWCKHNKYNINGRAAIAKPLITESNAQMCEQWCHNHKTWYQATGYASYGQMNCSSCCSLHQEVFTFREHPRKPTIWNAWFQQWNTGEVLWWFGQQYCGTVFCWSHY